MYLLSIHDRSGNLLTCHWRNPTVSAITSMQIDQCGLRGTLQPWPRYHIRGRSRSYHIPTPHVKPVPNKYPIRWPSRETLLQWWPWLQRLPGNGPLEIERPQEYTCTIEQLWKGKFRTNSKPTVATYASASNTWCHFDVAFVACFLWYRV